MNLFRSEEHARKWSGFKPGAEDGIVPLTDMVQVFSGRLFSRRLDPDYMTHFSEYLNEFIGTLARIGQTKPFWRPE